MVEVTGIHRTVFCIIFNVPHCFANVSFTTLIILFIFFLFGSQNQHFQFFWGNSGERKAPSSKTAGRWKRKLWIEIFNIIIHRIARNVKFLREQPTCLGGLFFTLFLLFRPQDRCIDFRRRCLDNQDFWISADLYHVLLCSLCCHGRKVRLFQSERPGRS